MNLPVEGRITQNFYTPVNYIKGRIIHEAVDIVTEGYHPLKMIAPCVVVKVINQYDYLPNSGFGNELWVEYENGYQDRFCHCLKDSFVPVGTKLNTGDIAAKTGQTGYRNPITTFHTHMERYVNGVRVDPLDEKYQPPKNNKQDNDIRMIKFVENKRVVWVKTGDTVDDYWLIIDEKKRRRIKKEDYELMVPLFGQYAKMGRVDWGMISGMEEGEVFDYYNTLITHPELFEGK